MRVWILRKLFGRWFLIGTLGGRIRIWRKREVPPLPDHGPVPDGPDPGKPMKL